MKINTIIKILIIVTACSVWGPSVFGGNIRTSRHNLSVDGPGSVSSATEKGICIFCHIPHQHNMRQPYLWSRGDTHSVYTPYFSSTLDAEIGQPTGSARMCLSCHDGTIALGAVASRKEEIPFKGGIRFMPDQSPANLGTNLADDHPVSFIYDTALAQSDRGLKDPAMLPDAVRLENMNQVQCISCHDPHDDTFGHFLVMDNRGSALCLACHDKTGWLVSSHAVSDAQINGTDAPWRSPDETTDESTVKENGCENCHTPHMAEGNERLLYFKNEEANCLVCHDGGVAETDISNVITKPYTHPVNEYTGIHDAAENFVTEVVSAHVECADCHNPHQVSNAPSMGGGSVSGANYGVSGVSAAGQAVKQARYIYEICFKCHADNSVISEYPVARQIMQLNTRYEFDPSNPSFHPVESIGKNPDVPSLLPPYTSASVISCTDCHGNDDPAGPAGPHGSIWPNLMKQRYVTDDYTLETPSSYALCYQCHSRDRLMTDETFMHRTHVTEQNAPCSACHDPHGISYLEGNRRQNSHLINFDVAIVSPDDQGRMMYHNLGRFKGECFLSCHGRQHQASRYPIEGGR